MRASYGVVLILALATRLLLFGWILRNHPEGFLEADSRCYWRISGNLLEHGAFSQREAPPWHPDVSRTPGYPLCLAALRRAGLGVPGIVLVQILLSAATCLGVAAMAGALGGSRAGLFAGCLAALDLPTASLANSLMTETLFLATFTGALWTFLIVLLGRGGGLLLALSAILMGCSALVRPIAMFFPFAALPLLYLSKGGRSESWRRIACWMGVCLLTVSPWLLRNWARLGKPVLCTFGSVALLDNQAAGALSAEKGIPLDEARLRLRQRIEEGCPEGPDADPLGYSGRMSKVAWEVILANPWTCLKVQARGICAVLFAPIRSSLDLQLGLSAAGTQVGGWSQLLRMTSRPTLVLVGAQLLLLAVLWGGYGAGLRVLWHRKSWLPLALLCLVPAYFCLAPLGSGSYARFRAPLLPALAVAAGVGIAGTAGRRSRG